MWNKETAAKLKHLRENIRKFTLRELSVLTAENGQLILVPQISRIENNKAVPHMNELLTLCRVLGVDLDYFFPKDTYSCIATNGLDVMHGTDRPRRSEGVYSHMTGLGAYRFTELARNGQTPYPLLPKLFLFAVNPVDLKDIEQGLDSFAGEAALFVQAGEVQMFFAKEEGLSATIFSSGDCIRFRTDAKHAFRATGTQTPAICLFILSN